MFRKELKENLTAIFGFEKTTYDAPADGAWEQETLFVEINECRAKITESKQIAEVRGSLVVYSQSNKLPFGFFHKRIQNAAPDLTKGFFFFNVDTEPMNSPARLVNISERRCSFLYLYQGQYDPNQGELTSITFSET